MGLEAFFLVTGTCKRTEEGEVNGSDTPGKERVAPGTTRDESRAVFLTGEGKGTLEGVDEEHFAPVAVCGIFPHTALPTTGGGTPGGGDEEHFALVAVCSIFPHTAFPTTGGGTTGGVRWP